jgi:hypothetical protein
MGEDRSELGHSLTDQYPRHDGSPGKVTLKETFVDGYILYPDDPLIAFQFNDPVYQQKGIAVRDRLKDLFYVEHGPSLLFRLVAPVQ